MCDKGNIRGTNAFKWNTFSSKFEASLLAFKQLNVREMKKAGSLVTEEMPCGIASRLSDLYQRHPSGKKRLFKSFARNSVEKKRFCMDEEQNVLQDVPPDIAVFHMCRCNARRV